jgi:hypothetical protein
MSYCGIQSEGASRVSGDNDPHKDSRGMSTDWVSSGTSTVIDETIHLRFGEIAFRESLTIQESWAIGTLCI